MFSSPFSGTFFQFTACVVPIHTIRKSFRPLSRGLFFNTGKTVCHRKRKHRVFVPFLGDFFSIGENDGITYYKTTVFVPFLGDFFSIACLRSPSPSALASALAAGMGDRFIRHSPSEMKCRFSQSGRASAGICNEKIEMRKGGAAHKNMEPPRRFETSDFLVSQT